MNQTHYLQLHYEFPPGERGEYSQISFDLPESTEYLLLEDFAVKPSGTSMAIGLRDPTGKIRGWSGSIRQLERVLLSEEQASYGYLAGKLQAGVWQVLLGCPRRHAKPISVELQVGLLPQQARLLRGDIHGHSIYSDGSCTITEKLELARQCQLDFLGFTDHNSVSQNFALPLDDQVLLLPSCEITTYNGHVNIFGYRRAEIPNFLCRTAEEMRQLLDQLRAEGVLVQLNHPIRQGDSVGCQWGWGYDLPFDWIEVWNGNWSSNCEQNLQLWQGFLQQGRYLPAVGNSDFHSGRKQGYPCNNVWVEKKTEAAVLSALAAGRNYLTASPLPQQSVAASCHIEGAEAQYIPFGTTVTQPISLQLQGFRPYLQQAGQLLLRAWNERGLCLEQTLSVRDFSPAADEAMILLLRQLHPDSLSDRDRKHQQQPLAAPRSFLRFELFAQADCEQALLLTNPIFFA